MNLKKKELALTSSNVAVLRTVAYIKSKNDRLTAK